MSDTVNSLLSMKQKLEVSSVKSVKHAGNVIIAFVVPPDLCSFW